MGRLDLGLGFKVLRFKAAPKTRETTKESKLIQKLGGFFFLLMCDFMCFFGSCSVSCCFFCFAFVSCSFDVSYFSPCIAPCLVLLLLTMMCHLSPCIVVVCFGSLPSPCIVVTCCGPSSCVVAICCAIVATLHYTTCCGSSPCVAGPCCGPSPCIVVVCCVLCLTLLLFVMIHSFHIVLSLHTFSKYSPHLLLCCYYLLWFVIPHLALLLLVC